MANLLLETDIKEKIEQITGSVDDLWLNIAWDILADELGYSLDYEEGITEEHSGTNTRYIFAKKRPVSVLNALYVNGEEQSLLNYSIYDKIAIKSDYTFSQGENLYKETLGDYNGRLDYKIDYDAGYTTDTFPNSLIYAVAGMIQNFQNNTGSEGQLKSYSISDISYTWKTYAEQNEGFNRILDKYRSY